MQPVNSLHVFFYVSFLQKACFTHSFLQIRIQTVSHRYDEIAYESPFEIFSPSPLYTKNIRIGDNDRRSRVFFSDFLLGIHYRILDIGMEIHRDESTNTFLNMIS